MFLWSWCCSLVISDLMWVDQSRCVSTGVIPARSHLRGQSSSTCTPGLAQTPRGVQHSLAPVPSCLGGNSLSRAGSPSSLCQLPPLAGLWLMDVLLFSFRRNLSLVKELGDRAAQGRAYGNLGNTQYLLGNFSEAIAFHKEVGDTSAPPLSFPPQPSKHREMFPPAPV